MEKVTGYTGEGVNKNQSHFLTSVAYWKSNFKEQNVIEISHSTEASINALMCTG